MYFVKFVFDTIILITMKRILLSLVAVIVTLVVSAQPVMSFEEAHVFLDKLTDMIKFLIPNYIKEGKYHQVKRMFSSLGSTVIELKRIKFSIRL